MNLKGKGKYGCLWGVGQQLPLGWGWVELPAVVVFAKHRIHGHGIE
jgi:hypothetical protein